MTDHAPGYVARALAQDRPVPEPRVPLPESLRTWREAEQLSQAAAARIAGVEPLAWGRWERGERPVPSDLVDLLMYRWGSAP